MSIPTPTPMHFEGGLFVWFTRYALDGLTEADKAALHAMPCTVTLDRDGRRGPFVASTGQTKARGATPVDAIRAAVR